MNKKSIISLAITLFAFGCTNGEIRTATVIEKVYVPESSSVGNGYSSSGKYVVTTTYHPQKFIIVFNENNKIKNMIVKSEIYFKIKINDTITYRKYWYGREFIKIN